MSIRALGPMFHGTTMSRLAGILDEGAKATHGGGLGTGFYGTSDLEEARTYATAYARTGDGPVVVKGSPRSVNPKIHRTIEGYYKAVKKHGGDEDAYRDHLAGLGHDALRVEGHTIAFTDGQFAPSSFSEGDGWTRL